MGIGLVDQSPYPSFISTARSVALERDGIRSCDVELWHEPQIMSVLERYRPDIVVHLAATAGVRDSLQDPARYCRNNVVSTAALLSACARSGCNKIVYASSSSVYGDDADLPYCEGDVGDLVTSPYAATKRATEALVASFCCTHDFRAVGLRYFTVYGPEGRPDMALWRWAEAMQYQEPVVLYGTTVSRDWTYVSDVVDATISAGQRLTRPHFKGHEVYNVGFGQPVSLHEAVRHLSVSMNQNPNIVLAPLPACDRAKTHANIVKAHLPLNFSPKVPFSDGIKQFSIWFRENRTLTEQVWKWRKEQS